MSDSNAIELQRTHHMVPITLRKLTKSIVAAKWIAWSHCFSSPFAVSRALRKAKNARDRFCQHLVHDEPALECVPAVLIAMKCEVEHIRLGDALKHAPCRGASCCPWGDIQRPEQINKHGGLQYGFDRVHFCVGI